jgi:predicted house-cleaning noncanonical NTP pyrophosphatase (MazG superfamily)
MKQHNKLVRDKILEIIKAEGVNYKSRILDDEEFKKELLKKLVEEANEVFHTNGDRKELLKELGDVWEVIESIIKTFEIEQSEIQKVKQERKDSRGGFDQKIYLEYTEED